MSGAKIPPTGINNPNREPMSLKVESGVKQIPHKQESVYRALSDLSNLEKVKDKIPSDKVEDFSFDSDSIAIKAPMVGEIKMRIIEREEPKTIKMESVQSPVSFNLWIQLLPVGENACKMKLTIKADVSFMLKGMVEKPLRDGVEKIADALAMVPYED